MAARHRAVLGAGFVPAPVLFAGVLCFLISGCSPGAEYPSIFPAVHDMPPPRNDATLNPLEVQQATEDLITARDHLNAQAPAAGQAKTTADAKPTAAPTANATSARAAKKQAAAHKPPPAQQAEAMAPAAAAAQPAGADPKP
jgi:hypothetical protein